ncbi:MAG TPA: hypothetical protein VHK88_04555, partial [Aquihabitans sp.]|nr:hypothetical protein [Aquihabitans sp.]
MRVASVPADHVYVRHLAAPGAPGADGVVRLADPRADGPDAAPWWPPTMLDERWVRSHAADFDVFHVHFGFDAVPVPALEAVVDALRAVERPMVMTVHDLRNPHHRDPSAHDRALAVLVGGATEVITLTPGAADEVHRRFGRVATVIPHPHVVDAERVRYPAPSPPPGRPFTVGIHLKSVRANMFTLNLVDVVAAEVARLGEAVLRVDVHDVVDDLAHHAHVPHLVGRLRERAAAGAIDLRVHPFFTDDELWDYLEGLDASLLPYRFGTHSGWLEACADLGTTVIAPT